MTEGQGFEQPVDNSQGQDSGTGINPAWNDLLGIIPSELHEQVQPHLQKWDQNYNSGLQKVHSQYEGYQPFVDNGVEPTQISYALQLLDMVESNPQQVMDAMQQYLLQEQGGDPGQQNPFEQQGQSNEQQQFDLAGNPQFNELQAMVTQMAQLLVQENQEKTQQQEDAELEQTLTQLREEKGDFDEQWVFSRALANPDADLGEIVDAYHQFVQQVRQSGNAPGPKVLGSGSSLPQGVNPSQMDDKGRRSLVMQMLGQQNQG
jgi:hypothetical protein